MFHLAAETSLFQCFWRWIFIFNFYACMFWLDFSGQKIWGGGHPWPLPILRPRKGRDYHRSSGSSPIWDHFQWSVIFTVYQCCMGNLLPVLLFLLHDIIVSWDNNIHCNFTHHCQGKLQAKGNTKEKLSGQMSYFKWGSLEESDETVALSWKSINDQNKCCNTLL